MNWPIRSTIRFFQSYYLINLLKIVSGMLGIVFFTVFWEMQFHVFSESKNILLSQNALYLVAIVCIACISYSFIQFQSMRLRKKEILVLIWYGAKKYQLIWTLFLEHLVIIALAVVFSLVIFDQLFPFFLSYNWMKPVPGDFSYFIPVVVSSFYLLICGILIVIRYVYNDKF